MKTKTYLFMVGLPVTQLGGQSEHKVYIQDVGVFDKSMTAPYIKTGDVYVLQFDEGKFTLEKFEQEEQDNDS